MQAEISRCVSTLISGSTFNYSIREWIPAGRPSPDHRACLASPPTWQIPTQAGADVWLKIWGCSSSCHKTRPKYHRTEKCPGPVWQLVAVRGVRNLSLLAATSKAIVYSAHTWRDLAPLIQRTVARSGENRNSRAMPAPWCVYFWQWTLDRMHYGTVT